VKRLYFDHNATCPMRASAREALLSCLSDPLAGNPSSVHADGRRSRQRLEEAREELAALLDCDRDELLFTSGGTESNAMSLAAAPAERPVLHGPVEHPSILAPLALRPGSVPLPVDGFGRVDPEDVTRAAASASPGLVTLALANHEVGTVQDTSAIAEAAHRADALVHCDASQAFGKWPLSFRQLDVDLMTLAAHKLGGPVGIGALVVRKDTPFGACHPGRRLRRGGARGRDRAARRGAALARLDGADLAVPGGRRARGRAQLTGRWPPSEHTERVLSGPRRQFAGAAPRSRRRERVTRLGLRLRVRAPFARPPRSRLE
jgi:cysteine desulfurase